MSKLALVFAAALVLGTASVSFAGEGSPDFAVPSKSTYYGAKSGSILSAVDNASADRATRSGIDSN